MKKTLSTVLITLTALTVMAANRTTAAMQEIARYQLAGVAKSQRAVNMAGMEMRRVLNKPTLSVYTNEQGFVIVSRDDRFQPVLAYGTGRFDHSNMSDGLKWWLDAVQVQMEKDIRLNQVPHRAKVSYTPIAPMMKTKWGQGSPYNNYCPIFKKDKTKAPVGCVATAMSQVINYQQYPTSATFAGSYMIDDEQTDVNVDSKYTYPYQDAYGYYIPDGATDYVNATYMPRQGNLVAMLCRDCGYAVNMNYNPSGSGAYTYEAAKGLVSCFGYPEASVKSFFRYLYTEEEWMSLIRHELELDCPVIYAGSSSNSGGHAFVFHGMDADGLFYVNWGWQGLNDGYYAFNGLNPDGDDFNDGQELVTGIRPVALADDHFESVIAALRPFTFSYDNEKREFTIDISEGIYNFHHDTFTGLLAVMVEHLTVPDKSISISLNDETDLYTMEPLYGISGKVSLEGEFEPGQYHLYMMSKDKRDTDWQLLRLRDVGVLMYDMTVAADGTVTIDPSSVNTGMSVPAVCEVNTPVRYYDLQGREVSEQTRGLVIERQGSRVRKIMRK